MKFVEDRRDGAEKVLCDAEPLGESNGGVRRLQFALDRKRESHALNELHKYPATSRSIDRGGMWVAYNVSAIFLLITEGGFGDDFVLVVGRYDDFQSIRSPVG